MLDKYSPMLMGTAMRYLSDDSLAKDALQETWIKVFNNIRGYKEEGKLGGWLKRILINTILQNKRKKNCLMLQETMEHHSPQVAPQIESELNMNDIMKVIETVTSPAREVFMMSVIDGMSHKEISEVMGIAESTSRVHLTNARKYLRRVFNNRKEATL